MHLSTQTESLQKHNTRIACREYTDQGLKTKNQLYSGSPLRHATALSKRQTDAFRLWGEVTFFDLPKYTMLKCNHEHLLAHKIALISKTGGCVPPTPPQPVCLWPWASTYLCSPTNSWREKKENYCFWFLLCDCLLIFYHQPLLDCLLVVCWLFNNRMLLLVNSHSPDPRSVFFFY